ncbi:MAG TPA: hypothetical protein PKA10_05240 [Selenomonadales bacterium]|nr:hypothetical protein [Selenomonadales bacterium]
MNPKGILLLAYIFILSVAPAEAGELSLGIWQASGSQMWRIAFPADGASELYYPQSGKYITAIYENQFPRHTLRLEGGFTATGLSPAIGSDSDWDYTQSSGLWYYGEFKSAGSSGFFNIDWAKPTAHGEVFIGYGYRYNHFRMTEGRYYIENYIAQNPVDNLPDLFSSYDMTYQGPHIGVRTETLLSSKLSLTGSLSYSPLVYAKGHGWWNLRNLDFYHTGTGRMLDASLGIRYAPAKLKDGAVTIGYRYQRHSLLRGTESTDSTVTWDKATNVQQGPYFLCQFRL